MWIEAVLRRSVETKLEVEAENCFQKLRVPRWCWVRSSRPVARF
jgi:hypothetical protein